MLRSRSIFWVHTLCYYYEHIRNSKGWEVDRNLGRWCQICLLMSGRCQICLLLVGGRRRWSYTLVPTGTRWCLMILVYHATYILTNIFLFFGINSISNSKKIGRNVYLQSFQWTPFIYILRVLVHHIIIKDDICID